MPRGGRRPAREDRAGRRSARGERRQIPALFALGVLAVVPYLGALANELVWDDRLHLIGNPRTAGVAAALRTFGAPEGAYHRPMVFLTFAVENELWPGSSFGLHLTNVALHALVVGLVFLVARRTGVPLAFAWAGAALFAVHPAQSEAVAYVAGRTDLLVAGAGLSAMALVLTPGDRGPWRGVGAGLATGVAILSKESGYAVALVVALLAWRHARDLGAALRAAWPSVAVGLLAFLLRPVPLPAWEADGLTRVLSAVGRTALEYLRVLLWPVGLQVDRLVVAPAPGLENVACAATGLMVAALLAYGATRRGPVGDWSAWTAALYLPVSNAIPLYPEIASRALFTPEHNLYAPMAGIALLLALALRALAPSLGQVGRRATQAAVLAVLVLLAQRTSARVGDWHDEASLFGSAAEAGSISPRVWYNLGNALMADGARRAEAVAAYREGVRLAPGDAEIWLNLGVALQLRGELDDARHAYERAIALAPSALAYENLGTLHLALGDAGAARAAFEAALRLDPTRVTARKGLGR